MHQPCALTDVDVLRKTLFKCLQFVCVVSYKLLAGLCQTKKGMMGKNQVAGRCLGAPTKPEWFLSMKYKAINNTGAGDGEIGCNKMQ